MKTGDRITFHKRRPNVQMSCGLLETCYPPGLPLGAKNIRGPLACMRTLLKRGEHLYELDDPISSIYSVIAGTFKTCTVTERGEEQVLGFHMRGAIMGLDAMATDRYTATAIAIEDSQVCVVSADCLQEHCAQDTSVAKRIHAAMAKEINSLQRMLLLLGRKTADERVASFLLELAATYRSLGYSPYDMNLVMTRAEIGSYLSLTLETVSRILSSFQERQLLEVNQRHIRILDTAGLEHLSG